MANYYSKQNDKQKQLRETLLNRGYYAPGETSIEQLFDRVASTFCESEKHKDRILKYLLDGWFVPSTPILSCWSKGKMPISCFLNSMSDNIWSITGTIHENAKLTVLGGGVGTGFSEVREQGTSITDRGASDGIIPYIMASHTTVENFKQSGVRRGSQASYLHVDHPEFEEFLYLRSSGGDIKRKLYMMNSAHHGVVLSDHFMKCVEEDKDWYYTSVTNNNNLVKSKYKAREIWFSILITRAETGEPYLLFEGNVNRCLPKSYTDNGLKVKISNLCVAPETLVLTKQGYIPIYELENEAVEIWNGFEWSEVTPRKTGEDRKLLQVLTSDGQYVECTENHKWLIQPTYWGEAIEKTTTELQEGDWIIKHKMPIIEGDMVLDLAYANGFFTGDGCSVKNRSRLYFYHDKIQCIDRCNIKNIASSHLVYDIRTAIEVPNHLMQPKFFVPTASYTINSRIEWFAGLCDSDGCIVRNGSNEALQISSVNKTFIEQVQRMLHTLGCTPKISKVREEGVYNLPANDGTGESKPYKCNTIYRLLTHSNDLYRLHHLGLRFTRLNYNPRLPEREAAGYAKIIKVIDNNRFDNTYCFTEPKKHTAIFNGVLTMQCSEITLHTGEDHKGRTRTAVCCLSSLNLVTYDEWKDNSSFILDVMLFMDNVLEYFINNPIAKEQIPNAVYSARQERSIGIGVMGFHSYLQQNMICIESDDAKQVNERIFSKLKADADKANKEIGKVKGSCLDVAEYVQAQSTNLAVDYPHQRFTHVFAIAPTATISLIAGQVSLGIEPYYAAAYTDKGNQGSSVIVNENFQKLLDSKNLDYDTKSSIINDVISSNGFLEPVNIKYKVFTPHEIEVFKPWWRIDQEKLIELCAERQKYICQSQSMNILISDTESKEKVHRIHWKAYKLGVKSLYYCRTKLSNISEGCVVCQ